MALRKRPQSMFSDTIVTKNSVASCLCDLYFPEPELKFDEFGALKEVCLSGENQTLLWNKRCVVHLCEIPLVPADFALMLNETGQDNKVCLNVTLNRHKKGELQYSIKETLWHECKQKIGSKWRKFLFRFDDSETDEFKGRDLQIIVPPFKHFHTKIVDVLSLIETGNVGKCTYMLVAIQVPDGDVVPKPNVLRNSISSTSRDSGASTISSTCDTRGSSTLSELSNRNSDPRSPSGILVNENTNRPFSSLLAPFDPAPYIPHVPGIAEVNNDSNVETDDYNHNNIEKPALNKKVFTNVQSPLCDSLHIHPDELPRKLDSILNSVDSVFKTDASGYYEPLNSEFLLTEDLYVQMGAQQKMAAKTTQNAKLQEAAMKTAKLLQTAINGGDKTHAKEYAAKLAGEAVLVTIDVQVKDIPEKDQEFNLKVYIEDKETSGGSITLRVKATDTIQDLKNQMLMKHMFPVEVQSWIIGKRIPVDTETLAHCKVKVTGHSAFLYLLSAQSVGLNREEFQERWAKTVATAGQPVVFVQAPTPDVKLGDVPPPPTPATGSTGPGSHHSPTPPPSAHKVKQEPAEKRSPPNIAPKPIVPVIIPKVGTKKSAKEIQHLLGQLQGMAIGDQDFTLLNTEQLVGGGDSGGQRSYEEAPAGWGCSACTYINQPTRPGCELCANPRPPDYKVPDEYVISEEEKLRLKRESLLEKQAQEITTPERLEYANHAERDLDNLLQFNDALRDTLQKQEEKQKDEPSVGSSFVGPLFRRNPGGEVHSEDEEYDITLT